MLLNGALEQVMRPYQARGDQEESYVQEAAANLIVAAYNQGVRDQVVLAHYALRALALGK